jgi:hypothetical protein
MPEISSDQGVQFPLVDGRRSTQHTARTVFAESTRPLAPDVAERIQHSRDWHKKYVAELSAIEKLSAGSSKAAQLVAENGLHALHQQMVFRRGAEEVPLAHALDERGTKPLDASTTITGSGERTGQLGIPYRGRLLTGLDLGRQLDDWVARGIVEPSCAEAVRLLDANPDWLDLRDLTIALVGAAAEMSPLTPLLGWGATIAAVDLPRPDVWNRIAATAHGSGGTVLAPARNSSSAPGADLLTQLPEIRDWLAALETPLVFGNYAYADGATFVRVAAAADALAADLLASGTADSLAYLASPTDVFAVPHHIIETARDGGGVRRRGRRFGTPIRAISGGKLFTPNYREVVDSEEGTRFGLADSVVPQQGPNYALAKRLQRWRAVVARNTVVTSANVAPATRTRSVVKNRILAAAYAGAAPYGVEVFETETSSALMAALLVHDLRNPDAGAHPDSRLAHPLELFSDQAAHGGLWTLPWEPRSVLPLAAVGGLVGRMGA